MKLIAYIFLCFLAVQSFAQTGKIDFKLKTQLDSIYQLDQKYRDLLFHSTDKIKRDSISKSLGISANNFDEFIYKSMTRVDSLNLAFIEPIIDTYGYPGVTLVGEKTNEAAFYVIQHSTKIEKYLPIIKKAGQERELPLKLVAMMEDRFLMDQGKEQIYGTQLCNGCLKNGDMSIVVWPIKDPENVNSRRIQAGFEDTVEQHAKEFNIEYRVVKLDEMKK
jgi:hypothetical protein